MRPENHSGTSAAPDSRAPALARAAAAQAVQAVWRGRSLDVALPNALASLPASLAREHGLIQEMTYGALRWHFQLLPLVRDFIQKPFQDKDADVEALLVIGLYQLLHMRVAAHAAVKETVEAASVLKKDWAKPMLNAVLRRVTREEGALRARIAADEILELAHPVWMLEQLKQAWPNDWRAIAHANNARPPLTLRVHSGKTTRAAYLQELAAAGLAAQAVAHVDSAVTMEAPLSVEALPSFHSGAISVQDAAAQLAAVLLDAQPGERVLDACAAPGGKAAHILERTPQVALTALDIDARRLQRIRENFTRLGLTGAIVQGDAARPADWWDGQPFHRILLDAPCSATGVIRRHPDIRLHRLPADIEQLAVSQMRLLKALWLLLAPGGKLLYVTCSIFPQENSQVLTRFLARQADARVHTLSHPALAHAQPDATGFQVLPGTLGMDGFYYAAIQKIAGGG